MFESNLGRVDDAQGGELGASVEIDLVISPSLLPSLYLDEIKEGKKRNVFFFFVLFCRRKRQRRGQEPNNGRRWRTAFSIKYDNKPVTESCPSLWGLLMTGVLRSLTSHGVVPVIKARRKWRCCALPIKGWRTDGMFGLQGEWERERRAVYRPAKSLRFRRVNKRRRDKSAEAERAAGLILSRLPCQQQIFSVSLRRDSCSLSGLPSFE